MMAARRTGDPVSHGDLTKPLKRARGVLYAHSGAPTPLSSMTTNAMGDAPKACFNTATAFHAVNNANDREDLIPRSRREEVIVVQTKWRRPWGIIFLSVRDCAATRSGGQFRLAR